ncbi:MAG: hypothetical protein WGN25_13955 [Candidatus Electrothrix sp. GW3-4]|uniref:hypothetical protein n=1 Tax=Candidatus Electrothrix sp. GW3-4 TaxID=3126740 RepID=UPI0030D56B32
MKRLLVLSLLCLTLTGCSSVNRNVSNLVFPPYPDSDQREGETVQLSLGYVKEWAECDIKKSCQATAKKEDGTRETALFSPASATAASVLQMATEQVQEFLKKEAERYTASYSALAVGDHFYGKCLSANDPADSPYFTKQYRSSADQVYACPTDGQRSIHLQELHLTRSLPELGEVMSLVFTIEETIDGTAFQIRPKNIAMTHAKAKVAAFDISRPFGFDLLAPWTVMQTMQTRSLSPARPKKVDVTAEVSITAVWLDRQQQGHSEVIATRKFNFGSIPLDGQRYAMTSSPQLFPAIPRSQLGNGKLGPGNFIVSVLVTEYDDYAERVMELEQGVEDKRDGFLGQLTNGL